MTPGAKALAGKVALVTGAGSGIGRAMALQLAAAGADVTLVGRAADKLALAACEAAALGGLTTALALDLTDDAMGSTLLQALGARHDHLDILVHSAGIFGSGAISGTGLALLREQFEANTVAPYAVTRALLPLLDACRGQVVFMNSSVVGARRAGIAAYAASKAALRAVADTLREEANARGIRVLSVYIGRTATPMQERIFAAEGRAYDPARLLQPDDVASMVLAALALPDTAEVTDLHIRPLRKASA